MKKVLSMILMAGMIAGPVYAASIADVTSMAQKSSGVTLDALSVAVYEAVKENPQEAVNVFRSVMQQRTSWSATETYAILRSVLLASPSLESSFVESAAAYQGTGVAAGDAQGSELVTALYSMTQTRSVASAVVQGVVGSSVTGRAAAGNGVSSSAREAYVPAAPTVPSVTPEYTVTPTPPPTSVNN